MALLLGTVVASGGVSTLGALPALAANACGLPESSQNVFHSGSTGEGLWTDPLMWSKNHKPQAGDVNICIPGGTVALVKSDIELITAAVGNVTTLRIEGTIRVQDGAKVSTNGIYGGTNLINGGVIQVLGNSRLDFASDQNAAPAFQNVGNVVGGGQIQIQGGSSLYLNRPLLNNGKIDVTGGGALYLNAPAATYTGYSGTGNVVGGKLQLLSGLVDFTNVGTLDVLAGKGGSVTGTIAAGRSVDVSCETFTNSLGISGNVVNNGVIRLLPPRSGGCGIDMAFAGGATLTNNGRFEVGNASKLLGFGYYGSSPYFPGTFVNGPAGTVVLNDVYTSGDTITNNGTWTVAPTGTLLYNAAFTNNGTFVNNNGCQFVSLVNNGLLDLVKSCSTKQKSTFGSSATLRLHADSAGITKITGGDRASALGGTLDVVTDAAKPPAVGTISDILETGATGTFASVTSSTPGFTYSASYPANNRPQVKLVANTGGGSAITALNPGRLLDTRSNGTTVDAQGQAAGLQSGGSTIELLVAGRGGVPADAGAAVLNVTVTEAQGDGFVTVWPCGSDRPNASSLNYVTGATVANGVIAKIGTGGKVCLYVSNGTQVLADVAGYFSATAYTPIVPGRVLDTRSSGQTADGQAQGGGIAAGGTVTQVQITGRAGVPANAAAAVLNVTVTEAANAGFVTVFPCGSERPNASSLNFVTGSTVPNNVIAKIGDGGKVCLFTSQSTHLIVDVGGYFATGSAFSPLVPARLLDSRPTGATVDDQGKGAGLQAAGATVEVQVTGRAGVPVGASAAVLNITVTDAAGAGFVTVWPCGTDRPTASSLNFVTGSTVPNGVIAKIGAGGKVCLFVSNSTHLIADVAGYFTG